MKQAILITAYKNYHHLEEIIQCFDANFELYIHLDKKSKISDIELANLRKYDTVKLLEQKYKVNWGGFNHLKSILYLTEQALKSSDSYYFHLISGHDFPIKKNTYLVDFFKNNDKEYIECHSIPRIGWANNGGLDRIEYYNLFDVLNAKRPKQNAKIWQFIEFQKKSGFKRSISFKMPKLYGGSTWWSLSRCCVSYVVEYTQKNKFVLNRFKNTFCSEEFYFQTVIMNSSFAAKVVNNDLRYIDWVARNGNNPAVLDDTDFETLKKTHAVFARKFDYPQSVELINNVKILLLK